MDNNVSFITVFVFSIVNGNSLIAVKKYFLLNFKVGSRKVVSCMTLVKTGNVFRSPSSMLSIICGINSPSHPSVLFLHANSALLARDKCIV